MLKNRMLLIPLVWVFSVILASCTGSGTPTDTNILFTDDFSKTSSGWDKVTSENGVTDYADGVYRILVETTQYDLWANPGKSFDDVKVEVDATKMGGSENNDFGIQCRYVDIDNYYFAIIASDGYYGIGKVINGDQSLFYDNGMPSTDKIKPGSELNHIRFDCVGSTLSLYINGDFVDSVEDTDLSAGGDVGLIAGTFDEGGTDIYFDNLVVKKP
jgi:hypothetical protein